MKKLNGIRFLIHNTNRSTLLGFLVGLFLVLSSSTPALASVVYNIDMTGGGITLTGTITADGATGVLQPSDIVNFDLNASGTVSLAISSATTGFTCQLAGCDLYVIGDRLIAGDQTAYTATPEIDFNRTSIWNNNSIRFVSGPTSGGGIDSQVIVFDASGLPHMVTNVLSPIVVGNAVAAVPEPANFYLLSVGLLCISLVYRCGRVRQGASA